MSRYIWYVRDWLQFLKTNNNIKRLIKMTRIVSLYQMRQEIFVMQNN